VVCIKQGLKWIGSAAKKTSAAIIQMLGDGFAAGVLPDRFISNR
jgi:hypothetical protein